MNGFIDVIVQLGVMVFSVSLGLLIVWGSLAGFFRVFFSAEQAERVSAVQYKSHALKSDHAPHRF